MTGFRILLLGKDGQVGTALHSRLNGSGIVIAHNRATCDLSNPDQLRHVIRDARPALIINAAAYTAVDKAETDADVCNRINAEAPRIIAEEAKAINAWLIHYSTDYVFDGTKATPYIEEDVPSPLNVYGHSKLAGDLAIASVMTDYTILRVSWVFGISGRNFAKTVLRLASDRTEIKIVADQFGTPTSADLIADTTIEIVNQYLSSLDRAVAVSARGLFNVAPSGLTSWYQYALELVREARRQGWQLRLTEDQIAPISTDQYPTPAARPKNSSLDTSKLRDLLGIELPEWHAPLNEFIARLGHV